MCSLESCRNTSELDSEFSILEMAVLIIKIMMTMLLLMTMTIMMTMKILMTMTMMTSFLFVIFIRTMAS